MKLVPSNTEYYEDDPRHWQSFELSLGFEEGWETLEKAMQQMQINSYADNELRHYGCTSGRCVLRLSEALSFVKEWIEHS